MVVENLRHCPMCSNIAMPTVLKNEVQYFQCWGCDVLFSDPLDNDDKIGGVAEVERNAKENHERIDRISRALGGIKDGPRILDFGCGHGILVKELIEQGWDADGYDLYNDEFNSHLPAHNTYQIVIMIECIEHTTAPYYELDCIYRALVPGGMLIVETSFVDVAIEEGIPLSEFHYVSPEAGHSTIFSHHALDVLMCRKGFIPAPHWNRHVRCYNKPMNKTF